MKRLAGCTLLVVLAIPVEASNPNRTKKERQKPTETIEPPLARPIPVPQPAPEPMVNERVMEAVSCPHRAVARLVFPESLEDPNNPNVRMRRLLKESEDLRQAREEFRRFWMNNQPSVLTYERLDGSIGP